jgi:hypothetical protein
MKTLEKLHREALAAGLLLVGDVEGDSRRRLYRYPCGHERSVPTHVVRTGKAPKNCGQCNFALPIDPEEVSEAYQMILSPSYKVVQQGWFRVSRLLKRGGFPQGREGARWRKSVGLNWIPKGYLKPLRELDRLGVTLDEVQTSYFGSPPKMLDYAISHDLAKYPGWLVHPRKSSDTAKEIEPVIRFW